MGFNDLFNWCLLRGRESDLFKCGKDLKNVSGNSKILGELYILRGMMESSRLHPSAKSLPVPMAIENN